MLQNNPNFTETEGTVQSQTANFNGMQETKLYSDAEKKNLQNPRPMDNLVNSIYEVPNRKLVLQDFAGFNQSTRGADKSTEAKTDEMGA